MVTTFCILNDVSHVYMYVLCSTPYVQNPVCCCIGSPTPSLGRRQQHSAVPGCGSRMAHQAAQSHGLLLQVGAKWIFRSGEKLVLNRLGISSCSSHLCGFWCWWVRHVGESLLEIFLKCIRGLKPYWRGDPGFLGTGQKRQDIFRCFLFLLVSFQNTEIFYGIYWFYYYSPPSHYPSPPHPKTHLGVVHQSVFESPVRMQNPLMGNQKKDPDFKHPVPLFCVQQEVRDVCSLLCLLLACGLVYLIFSFFIMMVHGDLS